MPVFGFARYLRPHTSRLALAVFFMLLVGVFEAVNLFALIPVIEIVVGEIDVEEAERRYEERQATKDKTEINPVKRWWRKKTRPISDKFHELRLKFYRAASQKHNKMRYLFYLSVALFVFVVIKAVSEFSSKYLMAHSIYASILRIKEDLFAHILRQDSAFFARHTTGFLESRINSDVKALEKIFDTLIREAVQQPITIAAMLFVLLVLNWQMTLMAVLALPLTAIPIAHFSRQLRRVTKASQKEVDRLFSHAEEALRNYSVVKVYDSEQYEIGRFKRRNSNLFSYFLKRRVASFAQSPIMEVFGTLGAIAVVLYGGYQVVVLELMRGSEFIVYLVALPMFYTPVRKLAKMNIHWQQGKVSAERIQEIFDFKSEIVDDPEARPLKHIERGIVFEGVTFRYGEQTVLDDINLDIPIGKVVAFVGRSGAGKSSLVNLIPRLYDPTEGAILIDGVPAPEYRLSDLRRLFGTVTQETILFNETVARNIAYAETGPIDMERVVSAARQAHAHEFILGLDGGLGYETVIGQSGGRLSGGQRQRIAIARAIYRDPQVLIFDEATSALDEESQRHVQAAIDNLLKGRTAIVIAHRLSTVRNADVIVVMDEGRIVETGRHDELMERRGLYWRLYSQGELEEE